MFSKIRQKIKAFDDWFQKQPRDLQVTLTIIMFLACTPIIILFVLIFVAIITHGFNPPHYKKISTVCADPATGAVKDYTDDPNVLYYDVRDGNVLFKMKDGSTLVLTNSQCSLRYTVEK